MTEAKEDLVSSLIRMILEAYSEYSEQEGAPPPVSMKVISQFADDPTIVVMIEGEPFKLVVTSLTKGSA